MNIDWEVDFQSMNSSSLSKFILKNVTAPYPSHENGFVSRFGHYFFGIGDGFMWHEDKLESATREQLMTIIAICSTYWEKSVREIKDLDYSKQAKPTLIRLHNSFLVGDPMRNEILNIISMIDNE